MAEIGTLGEDIVFTVSREKINTFSDLKYDFGAKYSTHERHLKTALLEYTGLEAESISFTMTFSPSLGTDPLEEIEKLRKAVSEGKIMRLIIGSKQYGAHKWVITKISNTLKTFGKYGNLQFVKVDVSLKSYAER